MTTSRAHSAGNTRALRRVSAFDLPDRASWRDDRPQYLRFVPSWSAWTRLGTRCPRLARIPFSESGAARYRSSTASGRSAGPGRISRPQRAVRRAGWRAWWRDQEQPSRPGVLAEESRAAAQLKQHPESWARLAGEARVRKGVFHTHAGLLRGVLALAFDRKWQQWLGRKKATSAADDARDA